MAKRSGADCIAVACPLCQTNLDLRQADIEKSTGEHRDSRYSTSPSFWAVPSAFPMTHSESAV